MKKNVALLTFILSFSIGLGQYRIAGQSTAGLSFGFAPASKGASFFAKVNYGKVIGDNYWLGKVEAFYNSYNVSYSKKLDTNLAYNKYGGAILAGYSIESPEPLFINLWGGVYAGIESTKKTNTEENLYEIKIPEELNAITGLTGGVEAEMMLTRKVSASIEYTQFIDFISNYSKVNYNISGGLKIYFN